MPSTWTRSSARQHPQRQKLQCHHLAPGGPSGVPSANTRGTTRQHSGRRTDQRRGSNPPTPPLRSAPRPCRLTAGSRGRSHYQHQACPQARDVALRRPAKLPSRLSYNEAPPTKSHIAALVSCADLYQGLRPLRGQFRIKILALMVHHNKGWEILHFNTPDSFHAELRILQYLNLLDAMLREACRWPANRAQVKATITL